METTADVKLETDPLPPTYAPWPGEKPKHRQAFEDYYDLGVERTRAGLLRSYQAAKAAGEQPPCTAIMTVTKWARNFCWDERVAQRDAEKRALGRKHDDGEIAVKRNEAMTDASGVTGKKGLTPEYTAFANEAIAKIDAALEDATATAMPRLIEQKFSILSAMGLGAPLLKSKPFDADEEREREMWDITPEFGRLSQEENGILYRHISRAKDDAYEEIRQGRGGKQTHTRAVDIEPEMEAEDG